MIARNFRRHPDALALQLCLEFGQVVIRRIRALSAPCRKPTSSAMGLVTRPKEAEDIPIGAIVQTPTGAQARVEGYRGFRRDHRIRLVCRYMDPVNKRFDVVLLVPELVTMVQQEERA